jgi:polysaccharide export outer membrane protein
MERFHRFVGFIAVAILALASVPAVFAQDGKQGLSEDKERFHPNLTGVGAANNEFTAANPGRADGLRNPLLGGNRHPLYRLRTSDVVEVTFTIAPEFNQTLTVQPDGYITLKDAGVVLAEGLTLPQLVQTVEEAYRGYLHDPEAAVALKDFERPYFVVGGQVAKPGKYELRSDTTVAEAVQIAGGLTPQSRHSQIVLFRRVDDELVETKLLNLKKMLNDRNLKEDVLVRSGDMVFVPQNTISKISRFLTKPAVSMYMNSSQF